MLRIGGLKNDIDPHPAPDISGVGVAADSARYKGEEMAKKAKNFTLSESTMGLLDRVDNASRYMDAIITNNWMRAQQALMHVQRAGWAPNEILAACDVLNGSWLMVHAPTWHGASLADGPEYAAKWEVGPERWIEMARQVSESQTLAFALDLVVSEFWNGNTYIDAMIRKGDID
jgi:hypothetical protein